MRDDMTEPIRLLLYVLVVIVVIAFVVWLVRALLGAP